MEPAQSRQLLERIIAEQDVHPVFQPIVELSSGRTIAVEALSRGPAGSPLQFPDRLFAAAAQAGLLHELDTLCAAQALREVTAFPGTCPPALFINGDPGAFTHTPPPVL